MSSPPPLGCEPHVWEADLLGYRDRALREARWRAAAAPILMEWVNTGTFFLSLLLAGVAFWLSGSLVAALSAGCVTVLVLCAVFWQTQAETVGRGGPADQIWLEEMMRLNSLCFENGVPDLEAANGRDDSVAEWPLAAAPRRLARWRVAAEDHLGA